MSNCGKGDAYRKVDRKKYEENYNRILGRITLCTNVILVTLGGIRQ